MLIALFSLLGHLTHLDHYRTMPLFTIDRSRAALKAGAHQLRSGFEPVWRLEVAVWALSQSVAVWMAVATAMLLAGCASFGDARTQAQALDPSRLAAAQTIAPLVAPDAPWPVDEWWKQFGDAGLNALVDEALADGSAISLRQAEARLRGAQAVVQGATARRYPTLAANAGSTREHFSENYIFPPPLGGGTYTVDSATLDFSYDLDLWGRNRAAIATARFQSRGAEADRAAARLALSTSVARAWFQLQRLDSLRDVTEQAIRQRADVLTLARQRFDAGLDTNAELRQAEALLPAARVDLAQIDEAAGLVRNQIAALLGQGPDRGRAPDLARGVAHGTAIAAVALPAALPLELVGRRPDIVAARWRVEAAGSAIASAKAEFYPNIDLVASAGFIALGAANFLKADSRNWSGGPALTLPIFAGGRLRANLTGRDADYDAAVEQYNQTLVDALKDVADQIVALQSVDAQLPDQALARVKTEQAYDVAVLRYQAGLSTYLTVLNAQTAVLQQERADAELKARVLDLDVALMRALGGGYRAPADAPAPLAAR